MKQKLSKKELTIRAAANALVKGGQFLTVAGCADSKPDEAMCHFIAREVLSRTPGANVVSGWCFERATIAANGEVRVVFDFHSLLQLADGTYVCPSHTKDEQLRFVPDPTRAYDFENMPAYNLATYATFPRNDLHGKTVRPYTIAWSAPYRGHQMISTDARHSRWVAFGRSDPFEFMKEQGLDPDSLFDLIMVSNLDELGGMGHIDLDAPPKTIMSQVTAMTFVEQTLATHAPHPPQLPAPHLA